LTRVRRPLGVLLLAAALPAAALSLEDFKDPEDGRFDTSRYLLDLKGFLPVPIVITEPAIGYGGGAALVFFSRNTPPHGAETREGRRLPPDITAAGGMGTENGTRGVFAGHLGFSRDGNWRYVGGMARASLNLAWFGADFVPGSGNESLDYNLDADLLVADVRRRIPGTEWMAGLRYLRADTESRFERGRPAEVPARSLDLAIGGLALIAEYDDRDSIFTPSRGKRFTAYAHDFAPRWGGDDAFRLYKVALNAFGSPHRDVVLGTRLDWRGSSGDTPFYALPFIELRGIPVLRYQGEQAAVAEIEARWNLDGRWSAVGFAGAGRAAGPGASLGSASTRWAGGAGFRYHIARAVGLHVGVDLARGPEEGAIYLIVGSAWR
jgi:hypothetical protein